MASSVSLYMNICSIREGNSSGKNSRLIKRLKAGVSEVKREGSGDNQRSMRDR